MATNTNITISGTPHRAMDVNIVGTGSGSSSSAGIPVRPQWSSNQPANGTLGAAVDCYPGAACTVYEVIVNAPLAADNATLVISADGSPIFNGYMAQRDGDNSIKFPAGEAAATTLTVTVSGSTDDVYVLVRYS